MIPPFLFAAILAQQPIRNPLLDWQRDLSTSPREDFGNAEMWEMHGHPLFGMTVASAGDLDADGTPDLLVANPGLYGDRGVVWAISGRDASVLHRVVAATDGDGFGHDVQPAGDVDADGWPDWIVGSLVERVSGGFQMPPSDASGPRMEYLHGHLRTEPGYASVYSGRTGQRLLELRGERRGDLFGFAVGGAGDVDGDGHADLVVGAPRARGRTG